MFITDLVQKAEKYGITLQRIEQAIAYLKRYGYLVETETLTLKDVITAVHEFNQFFQLENHDDIITPKVLRAMAAPRCSLPDIRRENMGGSPAWGLKTLNYYIAKRVDGLNASDFDAFVAKAFQQWADVADLKFNQVSNQNSANLVIAQGTGASNQFDGPGGVLAWAQLPGTPGYNGQLLMEFDDSENWMTPGGTTPNGIILLNVACHEFGHFLGLEHSKNSGALMAPYYSPNVSKPQQNDDIPRIQALYGAATTRPIPIPNPTPTPVPTPGPTPAGSQLNLTITGDNLKFSLPGYRVIKM